MVKFFVLFLVFSSAVNANIPMLFDKNGFLIEPDSYLLNQGLKQYNNGQTYLSLQSLKRSAKFGNDSAKYLIALIYLDDYHSVKARAWLKLIDQPVYHTQKVLAELNNNLSPGEIKLSDELFAELRQIFNTEVSYKTRETWANRVITTGTHIAGLSGISTRNLNTISGGELSNLSGSGGQLSATIPQQVTGYKASRQVKRFVNNYQSKGLVNLGEIVPRLD